MSLDDFRQLRDTPARATAFSTGLAEASINHAGAQLTRVRSLSVLAGGMVVALAVVGFSLTNNAVHNTQDPANSSTSISQISSAPTSEQSSESSGETSASPASQAPSPTASSPSPSTRNSAEASLTATGIAPPVPTTGQLPATTTVPMPPSPTQPPASATQTGDIPPSPTPTPSPTEPTPIPVCTVTDVQTHSEGTFPSTGLPMLPGQQVVENRIAFTNISGRTCQLAGTITGSLLESGKSPVPFSVGEIDRALVGDAAGATPQAYTEPFVYYIAANCPLTDTTAIIEVRFADWPPRQVPAAAQACQK